MWPAGTRDRRYCQRFEFGQHLRADNIVEAVAASAQLAAFALHMVIECSMQGACCLTGEEYRQQQAHNPARVAAA